MTFAKIFILAAAIVLLSLVGMHEYRSACAPRPASGTEAEHVNGTNSAHASGGLMMEVCEEGFLNVAKERIRISSPKTPTQSASKLEPAKHEDRDKEGSKDTKIDREEKEAHEPKKPKKGGKEKDEHDKGTGNQEKGHADDDEKGLVKLSAAQLQAVGIDIAPVASGTLLKEISVPGRISINGNAQAKVVPKLPGTVARVMKQVGGTVTAGEVLAIIESREMADAKGDFLAVSRTEELAKSTFAREERLWKQKVTAEQDYLVAKNAHQEALIKRDLAHQRLLTIGMTEEEIAALAKGNSEANYRFYELRAPIAGQVISRDIVMGQIVGTDREVFSLADTSTMWVEMSVAPADLPFAKQGQNVRVQSGDKSAEANVVIISPVTDAETRSAKVIAELENRTGDWRAGDFVNAKLLSGKQDVALMVPRDALQTIKGSKSVFVNEGPGFKARAVTTGREDGANIEILSGLEFGETIATKNTFALKAELGKAEIKDED